MKANTEKQILTKNVVKHMENIQKLAISMGERNTKNLEGGFIAKKLKWNIIKEQAGKIKRCHNSSTYNPGWNDVDTLCLLNILLRWKFPPTLSNARQKYH